MHIGGECIDNLVVNMMLKKKHFKKYIKKTSFSCLFISKWVKQILLWNCCMQLLTYNL
jgi:hypothetical protein